MFTVYHSNQVDLLKSLLVELIRIEPISHPFKSEQILVQSPGMSQWLKMALAEEFGVAANIDFPLPATFIWDMFTKVLPDVPKRSAFNKEAMTWKLMTLLPQHLEQPLFSPLKRYLDNDTDSSKLYQLAEKVADIFDGYLVYRPEWIAAWERGEDVAELEEEQPWQPILWRELYEQTLELKQSHYHRANMYQDFIAHLDKFEQGDMQLPERLFVFGISSLPPRYMDALKALGEHIDVHLMFTNPCRYYWGEVRDRKYLAKVAARSRQHVEWKQGELSYQGETPQLKGSMEENLHLQEVGNGLLASMGKLGRDNLYLLSQLEAQEVEAFVDVDNSTLLGQIQSDILNLTEHQDDDKLTDSLHKQVVAENDSSLQLHVCHSAMREVEVLHDNLLAMFEKDPTLKPRDVIVMVADINAYSPAIQAVFGNAPGERYIPFSISDRSATQESPLLNAFLQLLALPQSRCEASELLELLEVPAISAHFGFDNHQFELAKTWIEQMGVRWGLDDTTSGSFDLPTLGQNTWLFGVRRALLGYAMPEQAGLFADGAGAIAPFDEVQGMDAELAGKLAHYVSTLIEYRQRLDKTQAITLWRDVLYCMLDDFFAPDLQDELALKHIRDAISHLDEQLEDARFDQAISPSVIRSYLDDRLSGSRVSQRFLAGQVNFCTLMPMRSIPFNLVCLLGMNDDAYPRSVPPEGFDLMVGRTRAGDRSRRDDDRYLFLEALLSAQQSLYISYVGRSIQDNSERIPSVLVTELMEYCAQNYCYQQDQGLDVDRSGQALVTSLTHHHAMMPFSPSAFTGAQPSYAREWLPVANREGKASDDFNHALEDAFWDVTPPYTLELAELQRFWRLPVQYFFNRRLKVFFSVPKAALESEEPFTLGGLTSYQLKNELLQAKLAEPNNPDVATTYFDGQKAQGRLPVGAFGELEFRSVSKQVDDLFSTINALIYTPQEDVEVALAIEVEGEVWNLSGWLKQIYQSGMLRYRVGSIRSQDILAAWIDHLCLAATGEAKKTHLIGYAKKEGVVHYQFAPMPKEEATLRLAELLRLYRLGLTQPLAYFPKTVLAGLSECVKQGKWLDDKQESAHKKMAAAFEDGFFVGEGSDTYIQRIWPQWDQSLSDEVWKTAGLVMQAAMLALEEQE
ncbi:exodeoxyribonuclease V subunit gamma [Vibrio sp. SCSIO 43136]|uniref:exodeoxyribonuclease V subunit gamma n=1 Tax=Vibrio sp. SCSIO 43136 TaxID=2819101 RepID=UPI002075DD0F|nr:exodeoxyribonuclease V subunit gamma [Vibrio sp. SCSIO 43136]USD64721.1 exodeoxyribonuclease V subunit gamma [Vibrio sp. SCSIO 43136]